MSEASAPPMGGVGDLYENINITVRTLSGTEYVFSDVNSGITVRDLKMKIQEKAPGFPVKQQKLVKGSVTLDNTRVLQSYGIKAGDTLHLVKQLNTDADGEEEGNAPGVDIAKPKEGKDRNLITVICPENAGPGSRLTITPPGRETMAIVVPNGVRPGGRFQVRLPPESSEGASPPVQQNTAPSLHYQSNAPVPQPQQQYQPPPQQNPAVGGIMQVQCPQGAYPGCEIFVQVPGRGKMKVRVPQGVQAGQVFRFRLPG